MVMTIRQALRAESLHKLSHSVQEVFQTLVGIFFVQILTDRGARTPGRPPQPVDEGCTV
jgi:hypothetical protein